MYKNSLLILVMKIVLSLLTVFPITVDAGYNIQSNKVSIYDKNNSPYRGVVEHAFKKFNVPYEITSSLGSNNENLSIIFDITEVDVVTLPKHYIVFQTADLSKYQLSHHDIQKLSEAVAVWDYSKENIQKYGPNIRNYYYMPHSYEYADPVIIPCFLPPSVLPAYKKLLTYSNEKNTDISSHLPALFFYSLKTDPQLILEVGISSGESSRALHDVCELCDARLIGIDIVPWTKESYADKKHAQWLLMNSLNFGEYYANSEFKNTLFDVIFLDTSHLFQETMQEIKILTPLLKKNGVMMFHDSNVTPLDNNTAYLRINGTKGEALGNTQGVTHALKYSFSIDFDHTAYVNKYFVKDNVSWHMIHYPFCNGLTVLTKLN